MARIHLEAPWRRPPSSPRYERLGPGNAAIQWACGRRGRVAIVTVLLFMVVLMMAGARRSEALSSSYRTISRNYYQLTSWQPHLLHLPASIPTSLLRPSNTALELETGAILHVPEHLHKSSPNFHLLLSSSEHDADFCRTTMSAMIMNYPPPTIVNIFERPDKKADWEREKLKGVLMYLEDEKVVKDNDLVMLVDGRDTWFQLPSEVTIRQYMNVVSDSNLQAQKAYGNAFSTTILFGAKKTCEGDDVACRQVPSSILPQNIYRTGEGTIEGTELSPARFLDADTLMGPVEDLRALFRTALMVFEEKKSESATVQSVMSTIFGEQMLARRIYKKENRPAALKMYDVFTGTLAGPKGQEETAEITLHADRQYEFSIGLDYTHALFQPLVDCAEDELLAINRSNDAELLQNHRSQMPFISSDFLSTFISAPGPFWRPESSNKDPSPNDKPAYIDKLEYKDKLDKLPSRDTSWTNISLIHNTYTGAIPATLHVTHRQHSPETNEPAEFHDSSLADTYSDSANISWASLWYSGYERALLRRYFRTPQSAMGYHAAAVGGDLLWDQRGGRGGVWTAESSLWLPWGEVDGVCGTYELLKVFGDNKGVWFHEDEEGGGKEGRELEEEEYNKRLEEEKVKDEEWMAKMEKERKGKEEWEREKKEKERLEKEAEELADIAVENDPSDLTASLGEQQYRRLRRRAA